MTDAEHESDAETSEKNAAGNGESPTGTGEKGSGRNGRRRCGESADERQLLGIEISPEVVDPDDVEMLQDLITAAINEAMKQAEELVAKDLGKFTGGLNIPGLF
jgi:hypothetical protein